MVVLEPERKSCTPCTPFDTDAFVLQWRVSGLHTDWEKYASLQPALCYGRYCYHELTWIQCRCAPGFIDTFLFPIETSPERDHVCFTRADHPD
jgi:hypothetical protein